MFVVTLANKHETKRWLQISESEAESEVCGWRNRNDELKGAKTHHKFATIRNYHVTVISSENMDSHSMILPKSLVLLAKKMSWQTIYLDINLEITIRRHNHQTFCYVCHIWSICFWFMHFYNVSERPDTVWFVASLICREMHVALYNPGLERVRSDLAAVSELEHAADCRLQQDDDSLQVRVSSRDSFHFTQSDLTRLSPALY